MEDLNRILKMINRHYLSEKEKKISNMAIGRGCVTTIINNKKEERQIWITNRTYNPTSIPQHDITGAIKSLKASNKIDTLLDGHSTSKNTQWGRILLENYKGNFTIKVQNRTIKFSINNSSTYMHSYADIIDLKVGISSRKGYLNFNSMTNALKALKNDIDKIEMHNKKEEESKRIEEEIKKDILKKKK